MTVFNKISEKEASGKVKEIFDEIKEARQITEVLYKISHVSCKKKGCH